jgi:membrane protein
MTTTHNASSRAGKQPWWATALTAGLLAIGFRRRRGRRPKAETTEKKVKRGWRETARVLYGDVSEHRVTAIAAGVTYFALLAMFPFIAAIVAIYGLFGDTAALGAHLDQLSYFFPGGAIDVIGDQLKRAASGGKATLSFAFLISVALSLWSANAGMKALFDALNIVYAAKETRGFITLNAVSLTFTIGAVVFLLLAIGGLVVLPTAMKYIGLESATEWIVIVVRWPLLLMGVILGLALIYRFGPNRENAQWHWITVGSATTSLTWIVFSMLFSYYAANFGSYDKTYGSLGAMVGFMTWMWLSAMVVLAGAEIDAVLERLDRGTAK